LVLVFVVIDSPPRFTVRVRG